MPRRRNRNFSVWPFLSLSLLLCFFNTTIYILLSLSLGLSIYSLVVYLGILLASLALPFELSGGRDKAWRLWSSFPTNVHKLLCLILLFWTGFLVKKALLTTIKKNYEKN